MVKNFIRNIKAQILGRVVEVVIWDFDGTIFKSNKIGKAYEYKYFEYSKKYARKKVLTLNSFRNTTNKYGSWKDAASKITGRPANLITEWVDKRINKLDFIKPDKDVVDLICDLSKHKHIILSNARGKDIVTGLKKIGFKKQGNTTLPFMRILSRDNGINKPDSKSFKKVIEITNLPPYKHLMIGDSFRDDILPAKKMGFFAIHINEAAEILPHWTKK